MVSGDIREVTYNHPTLGSGTFFAKANEDSNYDLGGLRSNDDSGGVAGNGEMIDQMNQVRWMFEVPIAWDMNIRNDLEIVDQLAGDILPADWTFTHINGTVFGAKGKPVGDLAGNANAGTLPLKVSGGGKMSKIAG